MLISGVLQGLGAELVFAAFLYKKFNLPVSLRPEPRGPLLRPSDPSCRGAGTSRMKRRQARLHRLHHHLGRRDCRELSWLATRGLAKTGVLGAFASRKAATEPVFS